MRILVTGGAGFIGTNLIKQLVSQGYKVTSFDNYTTGKKENHINGCDYYDVDITTCTFEVDFDVVFHMAAIARIQPSFKNPKEYFNINANGTLNISEYCSKNNIPLIYAGSSSHHSGKFKNPYTFSKDIGEEIIKLYQEHFNLQSSIVRFYNVYGPHQLVEGGYTTLIGKWLNNIKNGLPCEIYGDGEKRRDFTHVDDIVDGLIRVQKYNKYGHIFELGRGKNYSINEVADMWGLEVFHVENKLGEAQETLADYSLAKELLNWKPKINLEDYLKTL
jgi:UDP-glucose 4-epimerase